MHYNVFENWVFESSSMIAKNQNLSLPRVCYLYCYVLMRISLRCKLKSFQGFSEPISYHFWMHSDFLTFPKYALHCFKWPTSRSQRREKWGGQGGGSAGPLNTLEFTSARGRKLKRWEEVQNQWLPFSMLTAPLWSEATVSCQNIDP